jgi:hypothetical protein
MADIEQLIAKVRKPPSLQNWVRLNHRRRDETTRRIARFVLAKPRHALANIYTLIADYVTFGVGKEAVVKGLARITNPLVRRLGREIVSALLPWLDKEDIKGIEVFHRLNVPFPIGRGILVPVKPTFVFQHGRSLTPVFVIGWASMPFSDYQKQLFATIIHRAILTLEGFEGSDAHIVCVPRIKGSRSERYVRPWKVSDVALLSDEDLRAQFDRFGNALDDAVPIVLEELARRGDI